MIDFFNGIEEREFNYFITGFFNGIEESEIHDFNVLYNEILIFWPIAYSLKM